jgi:predicted lipid carrier protein YhbT
VAVDYFAVIDVAGAGQCAVYREPTEVALTLRGGAEALLLLLWGRLDADRAGVGVEGDREVLARWTELVPTA